jgi:hypothetical protein
MQLSVPPLLAVVLVFRSKPEFAGLPDFITLTSLYVDSSVVLTLADACKRNSIKLLDRIWNFSQGYVSDSDEAPDPTSPWSIHQFTRNDKWYRQFEFCLALKEAIRLDNFDMFLWLSDNFQGHVVAKDVVEEAARTGVLQVLNFLKENGESTMDAVSEIIIPTGRVRHRVEWFAGWEVAKAGHSDVVDWLVENVEELPGYSSAAFEPTVASDLALGERLLQLGRV